MVRKVICALDTSDVQEALGFVRRLSGHVGGFKIGHALTLAEGLTVIDRLRDAGAERIFLDLKFHDIPNSVALAVREAGRHKVWMMTIHISGGPAMMTAAAEEAKEFGEDGPLLVGVSVLTSLDQHVLSDHLGVRRELKDQMVYLSKLATDCGFDGVVCSPEEISAIRAEIGHNGVIVATGIRPSLGEVHDQARVGEPIKALNDGADYLVIGRALTTSSDIDATLEQLGLMTGEAL